MPVAAPGSQVDAILAELKKLGSESTKRTLLRHGVREPVFGVKIGDLKKIVKRVKTDYRLALDLYATGVADAMYLAGLVADDAKMTRRDLQKWVRAASSPMLSQYTVPWVAAGSPHGYELALEWIESKHEHVATAGWSTIAALAGITADDDLDLAALRKLLVRAGKTIHSQPDRVRYAMNCFVIAVGGAVKPLCETAIAVAERMGKVHVDMGETDCKVPDAVAYLRMLEKQGRIGRKRKTAKC